MEFTAHCSPAARGAGGWVGGGGGVSARPLLISRRGGGSITFQKAERRKACVPYQRPSGFRMKSPERNKKQGGGSRAWVSVPSDCIWPRGEERTEPGAPPRLADPRAPTVTPEARSPVRRLPEPNSGIPGVGTTENASSRADTGSERPRSRRARQGRRKGCPLSGRGARAGRGHAGLPPRAVQTRRVCFLRLQAPNETRSHPGFFQITFAGFPRLSLREAWFAARRLPSTPPGPPPPPPPPGAPAPDPGRRRPAPPRIRPQAPGAKAPARPPGPVPVARSTLRTRRFIYLCVLMSSVGS